MKEDPCSGSSGESVSLKQLNGARPCPFLSRRDPDVKNPMTWTGRRITHMLHSSMISFSTAILAGLALGYILQRGRFCLNSAFRDIIFMKDMTLFRSYLFALVVAIVGSNLLEDLGLLQVINPDSGNLETVTLLRQSFVPVANIFGGFLFGLGIVLAGGCASGIVYRIGEGQLSALIAILGFFFGAVMTADGLLSPVNNYLKGFKVEINGTTSPAIW